MKQLLFPLLFLPCLALAQYPANANQKITLGEQTTADGLVYRGRLADTANLLSNKLDTSVYIVLDTGTRAMWYYRASSTPKWTRLVDSLNNMQGLLSLSTKVTGILPVANGGTGRSDNIPLIVQDQSGNFYNTIAIGTQVWFRENLRTKKYKGGANIPSVTNNASWAALTTGARAYYSNDSTTNEPIYGALYNWYATQGDSLCPTGWKVPTDAEWTTLTDYLASNQGGKLKATTTTYWDSPNTDATNETGFTALPGGYRNNDGSFYSIRGTAFFWSATEVDGGNALYRYLYNFNGNVFRSYGNKRYGFSVRCLKN